MLEDMMGYVETIPFRNSFDKSVMFSEHADDWNCFHSKYTKFHMQE